MQTYNQIRNGVRPVRVSIETTQIKKQKLAAQFAAKIEELTSARRTWVMARLIQIANLEELENYFSHHFDSGATLEELEAISDRLSRGGYSTSVPAANHWRKAVNSLPIEPLLALTIRGEGLPHEANAQIHNHVVNEYLSEFGNDHFGIKATNSKKHPRGCYHRR